MKRFSLFIILSVLLSFTIFAKDESNMFWEKEIDSDGQLFTYYCFKTDEQLLNNLEKLTKTITGISNPLLLPNINSMKTQMVSAEYIQNNYPKIYNLMTNQNSNSSKIEWEDYKYCFLGQALNNEEGVLFLVKKINEKVYFSVTLYSNRGLNWIYTNQFLEIYENSGIN